MSAVISQSKSSANVRSVEALSAAEESSLRELFLRGIAAIGLPAEITAETLIPVLQAGLMASEKFAAEMLEGRTERARIAKDLLCADVYGRCVLSSARQQVLDRA